MMTKLYIVYRGLLHGETALMGEEKEVDLYE